MKTDSINKSKHNCSIELKELYPRWASWLDGNDDGIAECYCFDWEGYLYMNGWTPDGYYVNSDGAWTVNGVVQIHDLDKLADDYYYGYRY